MTTTVLEVPAISCEHCVKTIKRVVTEEVAGVTEVSGDHETKRITVTFDQPATLELIAASMTEWDFPPNVAG